MSMCGAQHPDRQEVACRKPEDHWGDHLDHRLHVEWEGRGARPDLMGGRSPERIAEIIGGIEPEVRTGPPSTALMEWSKDAWVAEATRALEAVAKSHETFTTADVWPLVDAPREKRAMVLPVRHGLRVGWMVEDGAQRVTGLYTSRDGQQFPLNKLVPVYRSLVYR